jgi:TM2 domain-containing membrane protein YozV
MGKAESRHGGNVHTNLLNHPNIFILICLIPAVISGIAVVFYRKRNYIIGFQKDDSEITLLTRGLSRTSLDTITIGPAKRVRNRVDLRRSK